MGLSEAEFGKLFPNPPVVRDALTSQLVVKPWVQEIPAPIYITNAQVIDPVSGKLLEGPQTVKLENGKIASVQKSSEKVQSGGAKVYDIGGKYLCPGLIDAHVHVTAVPGIETMSEYPRLPQQTVDFRATYVLKGMLSRGFTSVRDTGGASKIIANAISEGLIVGPRLFQCGKAISQTGGHGDLSGPALSGGDGVGCCGGHSLGYGRTADGVPAVLKATREELKQGADFIKIMAGGGVSSESDPIEMIQYTAEELRAITQTAKQMGKMCTAHAYTVESIRHALDNGCMGIEHGNLLDEATARYMAEKGAYLTPTLSCYGIMVRKPYENFLNPDGREKSAEVMAKGLDALRMAHEAGVTICYGSDLLISMHALQTEEFTVRSKVIPSVDLLRQATINPAKMLKMEGKLGVIAEGAIADLIVLSENPLEDITVLDRTEDCLKTVIKEGRVMVGSL